MASTIYQTSDRLRHLTLRNTKTELPIGLSFLSELSDARQDSLETFDIGWNPQWFEGQQEPIDKLIQVL